MTLIAFLATVIACIGIARYNEDDSLFWKLFLSLAGTYAATTFVMSLTDDKEQNKVITVSEAPTQVQKSAIAPFGIAGVSLPATHREKSQKPVSKDSFTNSGDSILSEVFVSIRGRPQVTSVRRILRGELFFNTS